ncbi:MAG: hypothetical protein GF416_05860 [Candidatus Altiarchaeales archaeon]|nr:hypothetical protein [Candidatus Altiarchaeales archaeon]MBD3416641.1 hypothetical protein [Candidatus Altiarchaeales archaeon]
MAKSTIKIKHLGLMSTGKFAAVFSLIYSLVLIAIGVVMGVVYFLLSVLLGLGSGSFDVLAATLMVGGVGLVGFLISAVVGVVSSTIIGFFMGVIVAFVFNVVVKLSGGLAVDAEIEGR